MIEKYTLGFIAQIIIAASVIPYIISIFRGTVKPNRISWFIWSIVGFAFWMVMPESADEITKMLTLLFMLNPTVIFLLTLFKGENKKPDKLELLSLFIGLFAIIVWYAAKDDVGLTPLMIAIVADLCALVPTLRFVYTAPAEETPLAWIFYFVGFMISLFAIEHYTVENLLLPTYMLFGSFLVVYPLAHYRIKMRLPVTSWIV